MYESSWSIPVKDVNTRNHYITLGLTDIHDNNVKYMLREVRHDLRLEITENMCTHVGQLLIFGTSIL